MKLVFLHGFLFFEGSTMFKAPTEEHQLRPQICMVKKKKWTLQFFILYKDLKTEHRGSSIVS